MRERLEAKGGLKACTKMSDFYKIKRELDDYFGKKLEESGFEVCFGFCFLFLFLFLFMFLLFLFSSFVYICFCFFAIPMNS